MAKIGGFGSIGYTFKAAKKLGFFSLLRAMRSRNACKTCALGMGGQKGGMRNELGRWPEFCKKSIQAMASDMQPGISESFFTENSIEDLRKLSSRELESSGRLNFPVLCGKNETHYHAIAWDEAFEKIASKLKKTAPDRSFFYFSGRSSNEAGFLLQILARIYGTNHVNNCSFYCHQASGVGISSVLGSGNATLQLEDVEGADTFFLLGGNPTSNHPRLMTSLMHLKRRGGRVIVINPVKEPGLERFSVPSDWRSLFFGTKIADHYIQPHIGGDIALLTGIAKEILAIGAENESYIQNYTRDFEKFRDLLDQTDWEQIVESSGVSKKEIQKIAKIYASSKNSIFAWTMGLTHHLHGVGNVQALSNLALMRGMIGKPNSGLLPLRGHSNVQGMGTMGVTPNLKTAVTKRLSELGVKVPDTQGYDTMTCIEAAERGEMDLAFCLGGNLWGSNPDPSYAARAMNSIGLNVYLSTTLNTGHAYGTGEETLILPVCARDEEFQSTTQESMFNYVRLSDGGKKRLVGTRTEVDIITELGSRLFPSGAPIDWKQMRSHQNIRSMIAKAIPGMDRVDALEKSKKEFTIPGRVYHEPKFSTPDSKAVFQPTPIPNAAPTGEHLRLMSVRSEGQFNTVVYEEEDKFRGVTQRNVILLNTLDMKRLGFKKDEKVSVQSETGEMKGILVKPFSIREGNALMYYPEVNQLISRAVDPLSKTPAFKSTQVTLARS